jgi:hypothetical protein
MRGLIPGFWNSFHIPKQIIETKRFKERNYLITIVVQKMILKRLRQLTDQPDAWCRHPSSARSQQIVWPGPSRLA